jgi:hypothetical protein
MNAILRRLRSALRKGDIRPQREWMPVNFEARDANTVVDVGGDLTVEDGDGEEQVHGAHASAHTVFLSHASLDK